jgi:large subunit ribosomal protein L4e
MKVTIKDLENKDVEKMELPEIFSELLREDLIKRSVDAIDNNNRQPYGSDPDAGMKHSAELSRRRRKYRGSYGHGISRVPRKIMSRRGTRFNWVGAQMPGVVGGRRAHPPKAAKIWARKINKKENRKAIRSSIAASFNKELVLQRGHKAPESYPFIVIDDFEKLSKTKQVYETLIKLGLGEEMNRAAVKKIRAGKSRLRGRKYRKRKGPLLVVSNESKLSQVAKNIAGVDVELISNVNAKLFAPGGVPGRLVIFSKAAVEYLKDKGLFM